jgi:phospholipase/carboxylesterase
MQTRRLFLAGSLALGLRAQSDSRLSARPARASKAALPELQKSGLHPLGLRQDRDALLYIPESAKQEKSPLVISLHGATRDAERGIGILRAQADEFGFLLLAPASSGTTWDAIEGHPGADVAFINRSLMRTFEQCNVDSARIAMAGFSDGASCSLSLGLANGDLFKAVLAFSPGFIPPAGHVGKPPVFISHGTLDPILPIDQCSRRIVPELKRAGYQVTFREFEGKHTLPPEVASEAMRWLLA